MRSMSVVDWGSRVSSYITSMLVVGIGDGTWGNQQETCTLDVIEVVTTSGGIK